MAIDAVVRIGLLLSIWLVVFSIGASATPQSALAVVRRPGLLLRALAAMFVVVPAVAIAITATTHLPAPIRFAIVAMSIGPVPPILPLKQIKAGSGGDYAIGLLVAASLASLVLTPLLVAVAGGLLGSAVSVSAGAIARVLLMSIATPLVAGMILNAVWPTAAEAVRPFAQRAGMLLLPVLFAVMVGVAWQDIAPLLGDGAALAIAATVAAALLAGHLLSGGREGGALALAAACRHPGVALAIAQMSFPGRLKEIIAAVLLYLVVTVLVTLPYMRWIRAREDGTQQAPG